ncbi:unnamed protein product [Linum trigynum]|uniref:Gnk2-homologous domain-containing protein n=1 Tax=Linum trigynum TaxID=586398 RepID=A0AAV2CBB5_9ROSI
MSIRAGGVGSPSTVLLRRLLWILTVTIWLFLPAAGTAQEAVADPLCSTEKLKGGEAIDYAIVHLVWNLLNAGPRLAKEQPPGAIACYTNVYEGDVGTATAYGSVSCNLQDAGSCATCLDDALHALSDACSGSAGAQVTLPYCFMRFEDYRYCD